MSSAIKEKDYQDQHIDPHTWKTILSFGRKRWKYLEEHHPEMRIIDARNLVVAILQYARRTLISGDTKGLLEARNWSKRARIPMQQVARYYRTRFFLFLHCSMLFALTEYALYWSKSRLFRAGQIGEP